MLYIRGSRHDYDNWEALGCAGWRYENVLPYFMKSENNINKEFASSGFVIAIMYLYDATNLVLLGSWAYDKPLHLLVCVL